METYFHLALFPQWKQLYEMKKQKLEALEREMKLEEDKLIAQMEYARYILTQQLERICTLQKQGLIKIIFWSTCFWQFFLSSPRFNKLAFPFSYPSPPPARKVWVSSLYFSFPPPPCAYRARASWMVRPLWLWNRSVFKSERGHGNYISWIRDVPYIIGKHFVLACIRSVFPIKKEWTNTYVTRYSCGIGSWIIHVSYIIIRDTVAVVFIDPLCSVLCL
jgi:hypothetical protein